MRSLIWILRVVIFVLLLGFAIKNSNIVTLAFFFGFSWQLPMVFLLLLFFVAGAVVGLTAVLAGYMSQKRELVRLKARLGAEQADKTSH